MRSLILLFLLSTIATNGNTGQDGLNFGDRVPEIQLINTEGNEIELSKVDSEIILLDFWAGYCKPCIKSINSTLKPLYSTYTRKQLEIIGINVDTSTELWKKSAKKFGIPWMQAYDHDRSLLKTFNVRAIPKYFLLDKNKKIIAIDMKSTEIKRIIKEHLNH